MNKNSVTSHVVISGGTGEIGKAIAVEFLRTGAAVLLLGRNSNKIRNTVRELTPISKNVIGLTVDISTNSSITKLKRHIKSKFQNKVDILINAAGVYGPIGRLETNNFNDWTSTFSINVFGTVQLCRMIIPLMKRRKIGCIINFSGGGDGPFPNFTAYSASKGAIVRFTESLSAELRDFGISVNAIAPGAVNSQFLQKVLNAGPQKAGKAFYENSLKQKREGGVSPQRAAQLILFLTSPEGRKISGKVLSAVYDNWNNFPANSQIINSTDIYNTRRIKPTDRGYDW